MESDDEVDLIIDAWGAILPDVDLTPLDVMSRLRRVAVHLHRLRREAFAGAELDAWEFDVLSALRRTPPPGVMSAGQLSEAAMVGTPATSNRLRRLTDRGLVTRSTDPHDSRSTLVALTAEGSDRVDRAMRELVRLESDALSALGPRERETLAGLLRSLLAAGVDRPAGTSRQPTGRTGPV